MKTCFKCKKELPLSNFYKHKQMKDGRLNKCKECAKSDATDNRWRNIEQIRKYDRDRGNRMRDGYFKEYREKYPNKYKAHCIVNNAIRSKKLFKEDICEVCAGGFYVEAHHDDYLRPLNVRWLCACCHKQWHRDNGEGLNGR